MNSVVSTLPCHDGRSTPSTLESLSIGSLTPAASGRTSPASKSICDSSNCDEGYDDADSLCDSKLQSETDESGASRCPVDSWECENINLLWQGQFRELFNFFNHFWSFLATFDEPDMRFERYQPLRVHEDIAKVRFYCPDCLRAWTSMRGKIVFWYGLSYQTGEGIVLFKLFGQKCKDCESGFFEPAMWYPEEVKKVLNNVFEKVRHTFYSYQMTGPPRISFKRRVGKPKGYHNQSLCHACQIGMCRSGRK